MMCSWVGIASSHEFNCSLSLLLSLHAQDIKFCLRARSRGHYTDSLLVQVEAAPTILLSWLPSADIVHQRRPPVEFYFFDLSPILDACLLSSPPFYNSDMEMAEMAKCKMLGPTILNITRNFSINVSNLSY